MSNFHRLDFRRRTCGRPLGHVGVPGRDSPFVFFFLLWYAAHARHKSAAAAPTAAVAGCSPNIYAKLYDYDYNFHSILWWAFPICASFLFTFWCGCIVYGVCVCILFLMAAVAAAAYYYWKVRLIKMHIKCGNGYEPNYNFTRAELSAGWIGKLGEPLMKWRGVFDLCATRDRQQSNQ